MTESKYNLGDLVLVYGEKRSLLSRIIRWGSRSKGEKPTEITHVAVITEVSEDDDPHETRAVGAEWRVRQRRVSEWPHRKVASAVFLYDAEREAIARRMIHSMGRKYGWWQYITFAVDEKLLGGENLARRLTRSIKRPICSTLAGWAYLRDANYAFWVPRDGDTHARQVPWYALTPDDIDDAVVFAIATGGVSRDWRITEDTR